MSKPKSRLITSEMMQKGEIPLLFTGGACNIQDVSGPVRNPGRDPLAHWLDEQGWSYFDPQIHPSTHGREYVWGIDGPQEKRARDEAKLRIYEITATTISAVTMLEIMDDARRNLKSVVWFNEGKISRRLVSVTGTRCWTTGRCGSGSARRCIGICGPTLMPGDNCATNCY